MLLCAVALVAIYFGYIVCLGSIHWLRVKVLRRPYFAGNLEFHLDPELTFDATGETPAGFFMLRREVTAV